MFTEEIAFLRRALAPAEYVRNRMLFHAFFRLTAYAAIFLSADALSKITNLAVSKQPLEALLWAALPTVCALLVSGMVLLFHIRYSTIAIIRNAMAIRVFTDVAERLFSIDDASSLQSGIGKRLTAIQSGVSNWCSFAINAYLDIVLDILFLIAGIVYLATQSLFVLPFLFAYMVVVGILVVLKQRAVRPLQKERQERYEETGRLLARLVMEKQTILFAGGEAEEKERFIDSARRGFEATKAIELRSAPVFWGTRYLLDFVRISTVVFLGLLVTTGKAQPGSIVSFGLVF